MKKIFLSSILFVAIVACDSNQRRSSSLTAPANLPPADYAFHEFVDNRGCTYIRRLENNSIKWYPKVTPSGKQYCNGTRSTSVAPDTRNTATRATMQANTNIQTSNNVNTYEYAKPTSISTSGSKVAIGAWREVSNFEAAKKKMRANGYQFSTVRTGDLQAIRVIPKAGQTVSQLLSAMRSLGYSDAYIVK